MPMRPKDHELDRKVGGPGPDRMIARSKWVRLDAYHRRGRPAGHRRLGTEIDNLEGYRL